MSRLEVGDNAPDFNLPAVTGSFTGPKTEDGLPRLEVQQTSIDFKQVLAQSSQGVVVYFYPKASTPGCTTEACDFRDSLNSLKSAGYQVIGVSPDKPAALEKFIKNQGLNFPLASDTEHEVMTAWGAWGEKKNYGKVVVGTIRSTVVVDPSGKVIWTGYNIRAKGHVARLRKELGID